MISQYSYSAVILNLGAQQSESAHQMPRGFVVSGLRCEVICQARHLAGEEKQGSWILRDPKQPWGPADPGWHLTWVQGVEQGLGEQAARLLAYMSPTTQVLSSSSGGKAGNMVFIGSMQPKL